MNRHTFRILIPFLLVLSGSMACRLVPAAEPGVEETEIASAVEQTIEARQKETAVSEETTFGGAETVKPEPTETHVPEKTAVGYGVISGRLGYPSEFIPPLVVVAFREQGGEPSGEWYALRTTENQPDYRIENLPEGNYFIVAYLQPGTLDGVEGLSAGYTQATLCGYEAACSDHSLMTVEVRANQIAANVDPTDWYAPENVFPEDPTLK